MQRGVWVHDMTLTDKIIHCCCDLLVLMHSLLKLQQVYDERSGDFSVLWRLLHVVSVTRIKGTNHQRAFNDLQLIHFAGLPHVVKCKIPNVRESITVGHRSCKQKCSFTRSANAAQRPNGLLDVLEHRTGVQSPAVSLHKATRNLSTDLDRPGPSPRLSPL